MRKLVTTLLVILSLNLTAISLNKFGHILSDKKENPVKYSIENNEYYVNFHNLKMIGNAFYNLDNKYLTLTTIEGNLPTTLRIYNKNAKLIFKKKYDSTINFTLSENKMFCAFATKNNLKKINLSNFQEKTFPKSLNFSINNIGELAYAINRSVFVSQKKYDFDDRISQIIYHGESIFISTSKTIFKIKSGNLKKIYQTENKIFEIKPNADKFYFVEKIKTVTGYNYKLYQMKESEVKFIQNVKRQVSECKNHGSIHSPLKYNETSYPSPIGNSYAEIQEYGNMLYCHPGVDFLGTPYENVYAVHSGYVKAVLTTGGDIYWRIAIANNNTNDESDGYLYAHLNHDTIPFTVGDYVEEGAVIGTLVDWPMPEFTHTHFARLHYSGEIWDGNWWTADDPLRDVVNIQDTIPPSFQNARENELFAFRDNFGVYLNSQDLSGSFDIIAKCYDIVNSDWKVDVKDISYQIIKAENDSVIFSRFSYSFDMPLDTYGNGQTDSMVLNTIYSHDELCHSTGNYENRDFYHIITNTNGDSLITEDDAQESFDSTITNDGNYWVKVIISDAAGNVVADSMSVYFNNGITENSDNNIETSHINVLLYPNPFNPNTTISFDLPMSANVDLSIYNIKGQKVKTLTNQKYSKGKHSLIWNGTNDENQNVSSGVYFYKFNVNGKTVNVKKCLLMK